MRLTMVGTGYVGLVTGVCFSNTGNDVICADIDKRKIDVLNKGGCPIYEPGLTELMEKNVKAGRLEFTTDCENAYRDAQMIFICVGTPTGKDGNPNLQYVWDAADAIGRVIKDLGPNQEPKVIVMKSTVPVGTTLKVKERIKKIVGNLPFSVADNPEFLKEGAAINDFNYPDRVVCGVEDERTGDMMRELYEPFVRQGNPIYIMDVLSAEMVKYCANNFLATKISFINEMAALCEHFGANINQVREGMCSDSRIGKHFLYPGLGYGGSCFPKDTLACMSMGEEAGMEMQLSTAVHEVNQRQRTRFFKKIQDHFASEGGLKGKTIAFWGMAFKPRTDDIREAPAITLMEMVNAQGGKCRGFDPVAANNIRHDHPKLVEVVDNMYETIRGADAVVICTDWDEFKQPDFDRMKALLNAPVVFDGRNLYKRDMMAKHGFVYHSVGRAPVLQAQVSH
ncbi:MAG: UDP-glucose/GDP-mannose dehydrogenase family protein [Phycisphaeraceae bacterium]|nr:UDP-glucose/GDP-mannose dehydrogenase family protein [Phycisphaerales bacterium]MCB9842070.1 UDP-glucose/GDP-mannose dehydrogenase family protein [Phycisphaeraceae bacterium]